MTTTLVTPVRTPVSINRRYLAAGTFILLGLIDIFAFGLFAHHGDAVFALSLPGATPKLPGIHVPGALTAYILGAISIGLGILRAVVDLRPGASGSPSRSHCSASSFRCWPGRTPATPSARSRSSTCCRAP